MIHLMLTEEEFEALYSAAKRGVESFERGHAARGETQSRRHYKERKHLLTGVRHMEDAADVPPAARIKA